MRRPGPRLGPHLSPKCRHPSGCGGDSEGQGQPGHCRAATRKAPLPLHERTTYQLPTPPAKPPRVTMACHPPPWALASAPPRPHVEACSWGLRGPGRGAPGGRGKGGAPVREQEAPWPAEVADPAWFPRPERGPPGSPTSCPDTGLSARAGHPGPQEATGRSVAKRVCLGSGPL